jgi:hypothetical protein
MEKQFHGSTVDLDKNAPRTVRDDGPTGKMQMELLGESLPLSRQPVSDFKSYVAEGKREDIGETIPMNRTPVKGWDSHPTPMSHRANKQQGDGK